MMSLLLAAGSLPAASGHEHGVEHIEDGQTISKDPIVRRGVT